LNLVKVFDKSSSVRHSPKTLNFSAFPGYGDGFPRLTYPQSNFAIAGDGKKRKNKPNEKEQYVWI
jgi:hypothetical protein